MVLGGNVGPEGCCGKDWKRDGSENNSFCFRNSFSRRVLDPPQTSLFKPGNANYENYDDFLCVRIVCSSPFFATPKGFVPILFASYLTTERK